MLRRIELEQTPPALSARLEAGRSEAVVPAVAQADLETALRRTTIRAGLRTRLPCRSGRGSLSHKLRPVIVRVLSFWDHRIRSIMVGNRCVQVDPSGCYRVS